ncbi:hypothetical protein [Nitrospira moscoviensis]|uniref:Uncharacterized protein n=1 Tax=Nitrospira moscoviensis TaxID=42253 RepID=A0A0K2G9X6_NITMO|nr:hypothetical protein [Nitrospira moscoviensis]ALA57753.1 exported protein of unknown function [Nitrospira moscoviensis]
MPPTYSNSFRRSLLLLGGAAWAIGLFSPPVFSAALEDQDEAKGTMVAAGFGYQIGDVSTITVKVYDAASGDVLSDDTFELNVKDGETGSAQERIFAGGVGLGATDLSHFMLRVYDARTGRFQWEGELNLRPNGGNGGTQTVSTVVPRRATVTKVHAVETPARHPLFVLRALDPATGGLVWQDEFSADSTRFPTIERIVHRPRPVAGDSADVSRTFDFRIRMLDGGSVLWEDLFAQEEAEEESHEAADDHASMLPVWPRLLEPESAPQHL